MTPAEREAVRKAVNNIKREIDGLEATLATMSPPEQQEAQERLAMLKDQLAALADIFGLKACL